MNRIKSNIAIIFIVTISLFSLFSSCKEKSMEGMIVFTQVSGDLPDANYTSGNSWRYFSNSRIVALNHEKPEESLKVLTNGYFSACSPQISYDGKSMIFTAQKEQNDVWQIWEMDLENLKVKQVTFSNENCVDPAYLPGERMVFSKFTTNNTVKKGYSLFTCNLDGSNINQITFNPHTYFASTVLHDGRVLTISSQLYPNQRDGMFMILRPDGTKAELFYKSLKGSEINSRGWETTNGKVVFIESDSNNTSGSNIISVKYNRPLHSSVNLTSTIKGDFHSIYPMKDDRFLVSYRSSNDDRFSLYEFDSENKTLGQTIFKDKNYNAIEAIVVKKQKRPKKLPSAVNMDVKTGLLLCQDINFSNTHLQGNTNSKAVSLEVVGIDSSLGIVDVEKDGSFYLKVEADMPFRIQTIDINGNIVNGPGSWIYLRPNERRGCVGCHENNEQVPNNVQPLSVRKDPILIPVNRKKVKNKKISVD